VNPPATAESTSTAGGGGDARAKYARQIEDAFAAGGQLAGSALAPTEFYKQFLERTLGAIDAPAGAVWLRTPQGFLQLACQQNIDKIDLDGRRGARQCHNEVLRQVFQAAPPRPILLEPNGRMPAGPGDPGPVPPANLTDHFALFAPIVSPEKQPIGILEIFQDATHDPRLYPTFLNYAYQMAGYASQYHNFSNVRAAAGVEKTYAQVEAFARQIHGSLNPTEVAYHVANEGRKLIECDRLCVGVRHDRSRVTVEAVSGADVVEKASTHVRRLRALMESVVQWGDTLTFKGEKDPGLPPAVARALDDYLHESQPKLLIVQPVRDERETDKKKPARAVLVMEVYNPPEQTETLVQRLDVVAKHAAGALYNAAEMKRVPLKFLWWPIAKLQEGLGGKRRFYTIAAIVLLAVLIGTMTAVPATLRMEAKGQLQPVELLKVFPPREGQVLDVRVRPGQVIDPRFEMVVLRSPEFEAEQGKIIDERLKAEGKIKAATNLLRTLKDEDRLRVETQLKEGEAELRFADERLAALDALFNDGRPNTRGPGFLRAVAPALKGGGKWTVLNDDRRENIKGRTFRNVDELFRVGNVEGAWHIKQDIPQRNVGQILRAFADPDAHLVDNDPVKGPRKYLVVNVLLASQPDASYEGRLYRDEMGAEAVPNKTDQDENEPVVTSYVKLNIPGTDESTWVPRDFFVTGLEVRTRIRCGKHALGYTLFHGVYEWFYEKVIFFF
jgi:hypothetical protein